MLKYSIFQNNGKITKIYFRRFIGQDILEDLPLQREFPELEDSNHVALIS